jgi:hypothetical protein
MTESFASTFTGKIMCCCFSSVSLLSYVVLTDVINLHETIF